MPNNPTEQAIQMMVQRLVERFDPDQIILSGSRAACATKCAGAPPKPFVGALVPF